MERLDSGLSFATGLTVPMERGFFLLLELQSFVLFHRHHEALDASLRLAGNPIIDPSGGFWPLFCCYRSLALVTSLPYAAPSARRDMRRKIAADERLLRKFHLDCPEGYGHMHNLLKAEIARIDCKAARAEEAYARSIDMARDNGRIHFEALANELAGRFYKAGGRRAAASEHLNEAYHGYLRWGAAAKAMELKAAHPEITFGSGAASGGPALGWAKSAATAGESRIPMDAKAILKASQAISGEIVLSRLLKKLLKIIFEIAAAQRGFLILDRRGSLVVEAAGDIEKPEVEVLLSIPLMECRDLSHAIVNYVARTGKSLVLADAARDSMFGGDVYIAERKPKSILCMPLQNLGKMEGLLYLENNHISDAFTPARLEVLELLCGQVIISLSNAKYHTLQLDLVQAKINPHFLFNALSSIAELILTDARTAEKAIVKLSNLYRYILMSSENQLVNLEQEMEVVKTYLSLEKMRFGTRLDFSVTTDGDVSRVRLPGLLIQPLVENSIRHGIFHKMGKGMVRVHADIGPEECRLVVEDDGEGVQKPSTGTGFGLKSVQDRLNYVYGDAYSMGISRSPGYRVEICIPILEAK